MTISRNVLGLEVSYLLLKKKERGSLAFMVSSILICACARISHVQSVVFLFGIEPAFSLSISVLRVGTFQRLFVMGDSFSPSTWGVKAGFAGNVNNVHLGMVEASECPRHPTSTLRGSC